MKRRVLLAGVLFFLLSFVVVPTALAAGNAIDNMLPPAPISSGQALYDKYPLVNYVFDLADPSNAFDIPAKIKYQIDSTLNSLLSVIFILEAAAAKVAIYAMQWAYNLDIYSTLADPMAQAVQALKNAVFGPALPLAFAVASVWFLIRLARREVAEIAGGVTKVFVLLGLSILLFAGVSPVLKGLNDLSKEVSTGILQAVFPSTSAENALTDAGSKIWQNFILIPWELGEFGDYRGSAAGDADIILSLPSTGINSSEDPRYNHVSDWTTGTPPKYPSLTSQGLAGRAVVVLTIFIAGSIFGVFLLLLAGSMLVFQFVALLLLAVAPFVAILAIWPGTGTVAAMRWVEHFLAAALYRILFTLFLSVFLLISNTLYASIDHFGWFVVMLLQILLLVAMFIERKKILGILLPAPETVRGVLHTERLAQRGAAVAATQGRSIAQSLAGIGGQIGDRLGKPKLPPTVPSRNEQILQGLRKGLERDRQAREAAQRAREAAQQATAAKEPPQRSQPSGSPSQPQKTSSPAGFTASKPSAAPSASNRPSTSPVPSSRPVPPPSRPRPTPSAASTRPTSPPSRPPGAPRPTPSATQSPPQPPTARPPLKPSPQGGGPNHG